MLEIRRKKVIWTISLISFLVLVLGFSYYLYTQYRGFNYFIHPPSYYDQLSYIKLIIFSVFQLISIVTCGLLVISLLLDKIYIDYERLFYITCLSLCVTTIILEYFKFWERMYNEVMASYIIVGAMTMGIISLLCNILVNFVEDKIANNFYRQIEET